jgi:hypothetical protein
MLSGILQLPGRLFFPFLLLQAFAVLPQQQLSKKQALSMEKDAQYFFDRDDYYKAWQLFSGCVRSRFVDDRSLVNSAICAEKLRYPVDSVRFLVKGLTESKVPDAKFELAKIMLRMWEFEDALALLNDYAISTSKDRTHSNGETARLINACKNARKIISSPHASVIRNCGQDVNSAFDDYAPVIMPDESALYFTSRRKGSTGGADELNAQFEDIYVCYKRNGKWTPAENLGYPVNTETNDACVAISPDGKRMILYRTSREKTSGNLYLTQLGSNGHWQKPEMMGPEINSPHIETSACFSNDTAEIIFSSDRPGGIGGKDLYRIRKLPNENWSAAFNLGPEVNTTEDEDAPFLHPDGVTLYFSSKGHNSIGGYDVYRSVLNPETNNFSEPENLGYPINDVEDDIFFVLSADGKKGYYSSVKKESLGGNDIYEIDTRFGENDLIVRHGYSYLGNIPGRARITLYDKQNGSREGIYLSNPDNGKFILVVNPLRSYKITVEEDGYNTMEEELAPLGVGQENQNLRFILSRAE